MELTLQLRGLVSELYAIGLNKTLDSMTFQELQILRDTAIWKEPILTLSRLVMKELSENVKVL